MNKALSIIAILIFSHTVSKAQFALDATIRPRSEFRNGFKTLKSEAVSPAFFTEQRSRLNFGYKRDDQMRIKLSLQDVRIWGSAPQINKTDGFSSVHEAWGEVKISEKMVLRAGRQEFVYDDVRILGNLDWAAQGRSHDALKVMFRDSLTAWKIHAAGAFNQEGNHTIFNNAEGGKLFGTYYGLNNYKTLQFLHADKSFTKGGFSFLLLNNGIQQPDSNVYYTQTAGINADYMLGDIRLNGTFYYQGGKDNANTDVAAYMTSLGATYTGLKGSSIKLGADFLSGNSPGNPEVRQAFNPLYGTHHKFYGFMDYFYVGNSHQQPVFGNVGLVDLYLKSNIILGNKATLITHIHQFNAPVDIYSVPGDANSSTIKSGLGTEIDLIYDYAISEDVNLKVGYSQMFGSETMEMIKGGNKNLMNNWAFAMLTLSPSLIE